MASKCRLFTSLRKTIISVRMKPKNSQYRQLLILNLLPKNRALFYHTHSPQRIVNDFDSKSSIDVTFNENEDEQTLKSIKYTFICLGVILISSGSYLVLKYGGPRTDKDGNEIKDAFSDLPLWQQYFYRCVREVRTFTLFIQQPSREKLLPDPVKFPYHQPPYTLVLELTGVLVCPEWTYNTGWRFKKRPGLDYFLESLSGMYEIVIFTAEQGVTVFPLVEALDQKNLISYKLVRDATHFVDGCHVKNLDKLNRDLRKVIVIDWNDESVKFHGENLLNIGRWKGNEDDTVLIDLASFLSTIAQNDVFDVREVLNYYKTFKNPLATFREKQKEIFDAKKDLQTSPEIPRRKYFY